MKRTILVPAILALSTAGSVLVGTVAALAPADAATATVAASAHVKPDYLYQG